MNRGGGQHKDATVLLVRGGGKAKMSFNKLFVIVIGAVLICSFPSKNADAARLVRVGPLVVVVGGGHGRHVTRHRNYLSEDRGTEPSVSKDPFAGAAPTDRSNDPFTGAKAPADYAKPVLNK
jgi:hypothetical protein